MARAKTELRVEKVFGINCSLSEEGKLIDPELHHASLLFEQCASLGGRDTWILSANSANKDQTLDDTIAKSGSDRFLTGQYGLARLVLIIEAYAQPGRLPLVLRVSCVRGGEVEAAHQQMLFRALEVLCERATTYSQTIQTITLLGEQLRARCSRLEPAQR